MFMVVAIEQVVAQIAAWSGRQVAVYPLPGGMTNANYRVEVDGQPFFVRIPGANTELLGIDRENEYHNTQAAARTGVGPRVLYRLPESGVMVLEFIPGAVMSMETLQAPGMPARIAQSLKLLHAGPRFSSDTNIFRVVDDYLRVIARHDIRVPAGLADRMRTVAQIEAALSRRPLPTVPCSNDLPAENYIDDGELLRIIDFEYSGNNDPCSELGNTGRELGYDEARFARLCAAYFGGLRRSLLARVQLYAVMADVRWTLWSCIQNNISRLALDFWRYGMRRWEQALAVMDGADFPVWLADVQQPDTDG